MRARDLWRARLIARAAPRRFAFRCFFTGRRNRAENGHADHALDIVARSQNVRVEPFEREYDQHADQRAENRACRDVDQSLG